VTIIISLVTKVMRGALMHFILPFMQGELLPETDS